MPRLPVLALLAAAACAPPAHAATFTALEPEPATVGFGGSARFGLAIEAGDRDVRLSVSYFVAAPAVEFIQRLNSSVGSPALDGAGRLVAQPFIVEVVPGLCPMNREADFTRALIEMPSGTRSVLSVQARFGYAPVVPGQKHAVMFRVRDEDTGETTSVTTPSAAYTGPLGTAISLVTTPRAPTTSPGLGPVRLPVVRPGRAVRVRGKTFPPLGGGALRFQVRKAGRLALARDVTTDASGAYAATWRPRTPGRYVLQVRHVASSSASCDRVIRVR